MNPGAILEQIVLYIIRAASNSIGLSAMNSSWARCCHHPHFIDESTCTQWGLMTCLGWHWVWVPVSLMICALNPGLHSASPGFVSSAWCFHSIDLGLDVPTVNPLSTAQAEVTPLRNVTLGHFTNASRDSCGRTCLWRYIRGVTLRSSVTSQQSLSMHQSSKNSLNSTR